MSQVTPKYAQQILGELNIINKKVTKLEKGQSQIENKVSKLENGQNIIIKRVTKLEKGQNIIIKRVTKLEKGQRKIKSTLGKIENNVEEITQLFEDDIYYQHRRITRLENVHQLPTLSRAVSSR